jgi:hypothetical protein
MSLPAPNPATRVTDYKRINSTPRKISVHPGVQVAIWLFLMVIGGTATPFIATTGLIYFAARVAYECGKPK